MIMYHIVLPLKAFRRLHKYTVTTATVAVKQLQYQACICNKEHSLHAASLDLHGKFHPHK